MAFLLALVLGLDQKHTAATQQEFRLKFAHELTQLKETLQADKAMFQERLKTQETAFNESIQKLHQELKKRLTQLKETLHADKAMLQERLKTQETSFTESIPLHQEFKHCLEQPGYSLSNPRKHIWSFAAALDEAGTRPLSTCPCTNITVEANATSPPDFVGDDYFCATGSADEYEVPHLYADNPLWDGAGCGPANTCCSLNNPPWFYKQLESSTSEDIEMRVCCDQIHRDEDLYIEQVEIYVR